MPTAPLTVTDPVTGEALAEVPTHDAAATRAAIDDARRVQRWWVRTAPAARRRILLRFHDLVLRSRDELVDLVQAETGKNRVSAFEEMLDVPLTARFYANRFERWLRPRSARGALPLTVSARVERAPVGVVGVIAPWNYPLTLAITDAIPALLAGNTVVLKPDEKTPLIALRLAALLREAGLPDGVFQVLVGQAEEVGTAIVEHTDHVMFTGSTATARTLAASTGERLVGFSAELGGKNPLIVAHDADPVAAAKGAITACFSNSGQLCLSIERIYVHERHAERFTEEFVARTAAIRVGGGREWHWDMGSLISAEQVERVAHFVDDAVAHGARVRTGGTRLPELGPTFFAPTVLTDVPPAARLHREEVFGPVVYIETVASDEEAVRRANDSDYGLNASVWASRATGSALASRLEFGTVNVNDAFASAWVTTGAPMGGWKNSGMGRRHGRDGLLAYTEARTVAVQHLMPLSIPRRAPRAALAAATAGVLLVAGRVLR